MDKATFNNLAAQGYSRIPLMKEILADLDTPLSAYMKVANGPYSYLFESVQGGEKWGRYSIIGLPCKTIIRINNYHITIHDHGELKLSLKSDQPLEWLESYLQQFSEPNIHDLPRFSGGLVGYFGYETIRYVEQKLASPANPDPLDTPEILLMISDDMLVFDNLQGKIYCLTHADPATPHAHENAQQRLHEIIEKLRQPLAIHDKLNISPAVKESDFVSGFTQVGYETAVERIKNYIVEGDVMQVVLSQRMEIPFQSSPLDLYRALRCLNPSPYMYYLNLDDFQVVGSSPEILTRVEDQQVTVRPIAGTRPRGHDEASDLAWEKELINDPKELAEHLMLIDLGRNDVGRVANIGSVELTEKMLVERYSHVMHIVSNVNGQLNSELSVIDALKATFPAGTVSGAPKIRAMEIIEELEPVKRGIYSGAVGYISWSGNMDTAIAIRTAVIKDGKLTIQAGAGIVADSIPKNEWKETMNKGRAIFKAVAMAASGLQINTE